MNQPISKNPVQPSLADLMARYLSRQVEVVTAGLAIRETGEVVPFEAAPAQPIEPRLAWTEAQVALRFFQPSAPSPLKKDKADAIKAPSDWPGLVANQEPAMALPFCVGNYPQQVRNLHPLLHATALRKLLPRQDQQAPSPDLLNWAQETARKNHYPDALMAVGTLRLARHFDAAASVLVSLEKEVPEKWRSALLNEKAALAWQRGECEEAAILWQCLPDSAPVLFNRGMAALFLGHSAQGRSLLLEAIKHLPDSSAWHHLGRLYLTLADMPR